MPLGHQLVESETDNVSWFYNSITYQAVSSEALTCHSGVSPLPKTSIAHFHVCSAAGISVYRLTLTVFRQGRAG